MKRVIEPRSLARVTKRILVLLRARIEAQREGSTLPVAPLLMLVFLAGTVSLLVRAITPPFAYALVTLSVSGALVAVPLLGDLGHLLTSDESGDWVRALPVRPIEIHMARALHLLIALAVLSTGALAPAIALAPADFTVWMRVELFLVGQGQALCIAAALLITQSVLRGRAHGLLVAAQSALFVLVLVGSVVGLGFVPQMRDWNGPDVTLRLAFYPPAWFAAALSSEDLASAWRWSAPALIALAFVTLLATPAPAVGVARRGSTLLGTLLAPLRRILARVWIRGRERATFEWVFDALPKERDFVLRAYPLLAVPLGFLVLGTRQEGTSDSLLALLLFIPGAYVPLLIAHTPGSNSHAARWILDTAPCTRAEIDNGALKAVVARFLAPLYLLLVVLGCLLGKWELTLQLALPALLCCVLVVRAVWRTCVVDAPLSTPHDQLFIDNDWLGMLGGIAMALLFVSLAAVRWAHTWPSSVALTLGLLALERVLDRRMGAGGLQSAA